MPIAEEWLAQVQEEPIEPERPLIDPHHHLWEFDSGIYLAADLSADMAAHRVEQTVFVECGAGYDAGAPPRMQPVGETRFVEAEAAGSGEVTNTAIAAGIVGFADLLLGEAVDAVLEAHMATSPGRFRGIRHAAAWHPSEDIRKSHSDPPPQIFLRDDFRAGFAQLEKRELSFDAWCFHTQLQELADLAAAFSGTSIVLDHVGGPLGIGPYAGQRTQVFEEWREGIDSLAACANVTVKLGGLGMALNGFGWHKQSAPPDSLELAQTWGPYFRYCIEKFGVERCMFESNFPVDKVSCSYTVMWNAFKRIAAEYSSDDQDLLLHDNAERIYRL